MVPSAGNQQVTHRVGGQSGVNQWTSIVQPRAVADTVAIQQYYACRCRCANMLSPPPSPAHASGNLQLLCGATCTTRCHCATIAVPERCFSGQLRECMTAALFAMAHNVVPVPSGWRFLLCHCARCLQSCVTVPTWACLARVLARLILVGVHGACLRRHGALQWNEVTRRCFLTG
jgi:hypothetical protein